MSRMSTRRDIALRGLWKELSQIDPKAQPEETWSAHWGGYTTVDVGLHAIREALAWISVESNAQAMRTSEHHRTISRALEFLELAFSKGTERSVAYLSDVVQFAGCDVTPTSELASRPNYHSQVLTTVLHLLIEHGVPVELDSETVATSSVDPNEDPDDEPFDRMIAYLGFSPLHYAAKEGSQGTAEILLEHGATLDKLSTYQMTPLMVAALYKKENFVRFLLDAGANATLTNCDGKSALDMCSSAEPVETRIRDLLRLRQRYAKGPLNEPHGEYRREGLIHRTARGDLVRSKSEVIIADALFYLGCNYQYEQPLSGTNKIIPDFTMQGATGRSIVWEHAGIMGARDYRQRWNEKERWYAANGYTRDVNLFVTFEDERSGIDSSEVRETALKIKGFS